jgi:aryl-alcohol dehydrogenase-like predicted oxidoreductase
VEYRRLGRSGLKVSEICLGTMTFGNGADEAEAARMVHACFDAGVNFFDTADAYVNGVSEAMLGKALKGRRQDAVIASKVFNPMGGRPNDSGMSRLHIMQAVEASLKRLQTDYIDIYFIHHVDIQTPLEEMLRAFDDLVRQGKILYTACSNYEAWRLMEALWLSQSNGWASFAAYQPQYSLVVRDIDEEIVPACQAKGRPQGRRHALGRGLGLPGPLLRTQPCRDPADAARHGARHQPLTGADRIALGHGPALHDQRHRRRPQRPAARRDPGGRRLAPAGRHTRTAGQGVGPAAPLSARLRGVDGRAPQQCGEDAGGEVGGVTIFPSSRAEPLP